MILKAQETLDGEIVVDNFAGGGGASTGIELALGRIVNAAINHDPDGYIKFITDEIRLAIGGETDEEEACRLNVRHSIAVIESSLAIHEEEEHGLKVIGALYRLEDGKVEYF